MKPEKHFQKEIRNSIIWTAALTTLFIVYNLNPDVIFKMLIALPFFIVLYFLLFTIGKATVSGRIKIWLNSGIKKTVLFPAILVALYFGYNLVIKENPFQGTVSLIPYLIFFPVLVFAARRKEETKIDWLDFTTFILFLLPITLIDANPYGNLPVSGNQFDSVYRISMMLVAVYAFVTVRGLKDVGFFPEFRLKNLWTAVWVWLAFYGAVFIIGYSVHFIQLKGHGSFSIRLITTIIMVIVTTFLHTALFEELFFRGLLQNMLSKRIHQSKSWIVFWKWGLIILLPLALLVGYTLKGGIQWFPAFATVLMFLAAYYIERSGKFQLGSYTSLAISGVLFGLVHYHAGSTVYIGFACIAGWAYGYTWIKTKNVFYSALVHALVNSSALIFGLELIK
jgi:uncharacterized protein